MFAKTKIILSERHNDINEIHARALQEMIAFQTAKKLEYIDISRDRKNPAMVFVEWVEMLPLWKRIAIRLGFLPEDNRERNGFFISKAELWSMVEG